MKALIIINEPFGQMAVGKSTSLAYILSCLELGFETYIYNFDEEKKFSSNLAARFLDPQKSEIKNLITKYKEINFEALQNLKVEELVNNLAKIEVAANDFDLVFQRLEPMKSPFPPNGNQNLNQVLKEIQKNFPKCLINLPIDLFDKEAPQEVDRILSKKGEEKIATPTIEFEILDEKFPQIFIQNKVVLKPKNSAQSFGIFAVEKSSQGFDLKSLQKVAINDLIKSQAYKIKDDLSDDEIKKIIEILLCTQRLKIDKKILENYQNKNFSEISRDEIQQMAQQLYNGKILLQPFLEGVKIGDVRSLFFKDANNNFYLAGHVFRKNIREISDNNFVTSYLSGAVKASLILELSIEEQNDLSKKCHKLLEILNGELAEKYRNSLELGVDFILVGNGKNLLLGEINHNCPALMPVAESLMKESGKYDGGLFYIKKVVWDVFKRRVLVG